MAFKPIDKTIKKNVLYAFRHVEIRQCETCPFYSYREGGMNNYEHRCSLGTKIDTNERIPKDCTLLVDD